MIIFKYREISKPGKVRGFLKLKKEKKNRRLFYCIILLPRRDLPPPLLFPNRLARCEESRVEHPNLSLSLSLSDPRPLALARSHNHTLLSENPFKAMVKETLAAPSSSSPSSSSSTASLSDTNLPPPEDAWIDTYHKLLPHWQSLSHTHLVLFPPLP